MFMEFANVFELKEHVMPALKLRVSELRKQNININVDELFNYFVNIWKNEYNLTLSDIVDDILYREIDNR